jgi:hypothetical protein
LKVRSRNHLDVAKRHRKRMSEMARCPLEIFMPEVNKAGDFFGNDYPALPDKGNVMVTVA